MGKYTYELDKRSPECLYIGRHKGNYCPMYVKLVKPEKCGFGRNIFRNREKQFTK